MKNFKKYLLVIVTGSLAIIIVSYISLASYIATKAEIDTKTKADVLLVLGAKSYIDGKYNPVFPVVSAAGALVGKFENRSGFQVSYEG